MKLDSQPRDDQQVELTVEFEPATLEDFKRRAAKRLANRVKIPGFHPGKAPYNVVVRQIGEGTILARGVLFTGDTTDNIPGLRGVGPVKAAKLLDGPELTTESALWRVVSQEYRERHPEDWRERTLEIGRLLWIRRRPDEWWSPPEEETHDRGVDGGDSERSVRVPEGVPAEERGV